MQCRIFEDRMSRYFREVDAEIYRDAITKDDWSKVRASARDPNHLLLIMFQPAMTAQQAFGST